MLSMLYRTAEATACLERCRRLYPQTVRARQLLLDIYRWQHREEEGRAIRDELLRLAQSKTTADRLWILVRSFIEEYTQIEDNENWDYLLRCWNRNKNDPAVRIAMARHLILFRDKVELAAKDLELLLPYSPDSVSAISSLIEYYLNIEGKSLARAEELLQRWPAEYRFHSYWRYRGQILEMRGRIGDAVDAYRRALADRPDDVRSLTRLIALLSRLAGQGDDTLLAERSELSKRLYDAQLARAKALELVNQINLWLKQWDEFNRGLASPPELTILKQVADFYARLGRKEESRRWHAVYRELEEAIAVMSPSAATSSGSG
jgi:tetratricopeptide (TPR) repeat protein